MARKTGFSIIEVVWVLALLGVLGLAAVVLVPSSGPAQLDAAAKQVRSDIEYARQLAMTTGQTHGVQFVSGGTYTVYQGTVATPIAHPLTKSSMVVTLSNNYVGVSIQSPYTVEFDSLGGASLGGGGSVTIGDGSATKVIAVTANTGSVVIQ